MVLLMRGLAGLAGASGAVTADGVVGGATGADSGAASVAGDGKPFITMVGFALDSGADWDGAAVAAVVGTSGLRPDGMVKWIGEGAGGCGGSAADAVAPSGGTIGTGPTA